MSSAREGEIRGIFGRPFVPLDRFVDTSALPAIHDEVCAALANVSADYTGGSHRSMGIMPPSREDEAIVDYGEVIAAMSGTEFEAFRALSDDPKAIDPSRRAELTFGEEREHPLSRRQMLWLEARFGVYFPWKAYVELIPNRYWTDKAKIEGKDWSRVAKAFFPKTIAFVKSLPFVGVGRCNVMGLRAHDHGTTHRDGHPGEQVAPDHFITVCPAPLDRGKRLFLWDEAKREKTRVTGHAYWFNDFDYHGVEADPFFRYSIRIDGVFEPDFVAMLEREMAAEGER